MLFPGQRDRSYSSSVWRDIKRSQTLSGRRDDITSNRTWGARARLYLRLFTLCGDRDRS